MAGKVNETLKEMAGKVNDNGKVSVNRFSKKNFNKLLKAMMNDTDFSIKVPVVKGGEVDHYEEVMVNENFRKFLKKVLEKAGVDKNESSVVMDSSFTIDNVDGVYEFITTAIYEYMNAGNKFDFLPREDFKGSVAVKKNPKKTKRSHAKNPRDGKDLGEFEYTNEPYTSLVVSSPCPEYLKNRKKV